MAKPGASKKNREPSKHSRAARRATSPSIDTDKSLKNVKPPPESVNHRPAVLQAHHGSGISKKAKRGRKAVLSTKARKRQERGADRAEAVMDKTVMKIEKSRGQSRVIQNRSKTWDEVNKQNPDTRQRPAAREDLSDDGDERAGPPTAGAPGGSGWETDEEMDGAGDVTGNPAGSATALENAAAPAAQVDDDDEIL